MCVLPYSMMISVLTFSNKPQKSFHQEFWEALIYTDYKNIPLFFILRIAPQMQVIFAPSSAQLTRTCVSRVSTTSGCRCTTTPRTPALSNAKPRSRACWWSWPPKCWMGHAATPSPWTCVSAESARFETESESLSSYLFL